MVNDAEQYKAEDEKQKEKISAKNNLESYCFNMKSTIEDEKLKDKIGESDKEAIAKKCEETIKWLDANQLAEVDESKINKKKLKGSATQSSQNYTNKPVEHQVACLEVCQVVCQEACQVVCQVVQEEQEPEALVELEGQPSKK